MKIYKSKYGTIEYKYPNCSDIMSLISGGDFDITRLGDVEYAKHNFGDLVSTCVKKLYKLIIKIDIEIDGQRFDKFEQLDGDLRFAMDLHNIGGDVINVIMAALGANNEKKTELAS